MSAAAEATAVRPFRVEVAEEPLADLRRRVAWEEPALFSAEVRAAFGAVR